MRREDAEDHVDVVEAFAATDGRQVHAIKTLLLVTAHKFWLDDRADRSRIAHLCRALPQWGIDLRVFLACDISEADRAELKTAWQNVPCYTGPAGQGPRERGAFFNCQSRQVRWWRRWLPIHRPRQPIARCEPTLEALASRALRAAFTEVVQRVKPEIVFVEYLWLAYLAADIPRSGVRGTMYMIDTHDVMHLRCGRFHEAGQRHWANVTEADERRALAHFDVIIAIQPDEAVEFRRLVPGTRVIVAGHPTELAWMPPRASGPVRLAFVGAQGLPNQRALRDFLEEVWPALRARHGAEVEFHIYGAVCNSLRALPPMEGVFRHGPVPTLSAIYADADIMVNPVQFGGGLKKKNTEALCFGKPLVTTPEGAAGMGAGMGEAFLVCPTHAAQAEALSGLIEKPSARAALATKAFAYAGTHFSPNVMYAELRATLAAL